MACRTPSWTVLDPGVLIRTLSSRTPIDRAGAPVHIARTGLAVAATLLTLGGCASAEDVAAPDQDETSSSTTTDEPTDEPTDDKPDEPERPSTPVPEIGDCRRLDGDIVVSGYTDSAVSPVDCGQSHNTQTVYVTSASGAVQKALERGDSNEIFELMLPRCRAKLASWTGGDLERLSRTTFGVVVGVPPAEDVKLGADWVRCDASLNGADGQPVALPEQTQGTLRAENGDYDLCVRGDFTRRGTTVVPCARAHDYRAVAAVRLGNPASSYPGEGKVRQVLKRRCPAEATDYLGSSARYGYTYPTAPQWATSTGYGTCYAMTKK